MVFFGMYNIVDFTRFVLCFRKKVIFWCGSDIKLLKDRQYFQWIIRHSTAKHICENAREQRLLSSFGIQSSIQPCLVDVIDKLPVMFLSSKNPHVYLTIHPGREKEYGLPIVHKIAPFVPEVTFHVFGIGSSKATLQEGFSYGEVNVPQKDFTVRATTHSTVEDNIVYHGQVPDPVFNEKITKYHAALRLNTFDGFAETLSKSACMGQYPISNIAYPHITHATTLRTLIDALKGLSKKKRPNIEAAFYWKHELSKSLDEILNEI